MANLPVKCYYCSTIINTKLNNSNQNYWCHICIDNYQLEDVVSSFDANKELLYIHIYYNDYHIRLHIQEDFTIIFNKDSSGNYGNFIVKLPGFPLSPQNIKDKLKLYLTFL